MTDCNTPEEQILQDLSGEQQFFWDHETMESFRTDPDIAKATEQLHQRLSHPKPEQADAVRRKPSTGEI